MPRRARMALIGATVGVGLLALTWYAKVYVEVIRHADRSILQGFADLHRPGLNRFTSFVANLCDPKPYVFLAAIPMIVALIRRRPRVAATIGVVLFAANATTQLLKPVAAEPHLLHLLARVPIPPASWPSGHATAAMSLALCCVIAAPSRWRPRVAASMAAFAVAVVYSFLELGWHYPSDVLGGFLVASIWTLLGAATLDLVDARWPRRAGWSEPGRSRPVSLAEALTPVIVLIAGALLFAALIALARPHAVVTYARAHQAFMVGAAGIGVTSLLLATGASLALRR